MNIHLLLLGKNKPSYVDEAVGVFEKQLKPYCNLEISYLKDEKIHDNVSKILQKESKTIEKHIKPDDYLIVCDERGKTFDSIQLADHFSLLKDKGTPHIVILIGSSHGIAKELKERADLRLSLSALTMNHQVVRLILLEQLYRIFTLMRGMKYHK